MKRSYRAALKTAKRLFEAKRRRRRKLAGLSFREKIAIIVSMQKIENGIRRARHLSLRPVWSV